MTTDQKNVSRANRGTLPYPPQANHLYAVVRGRKVLSRKGREYRQSAAIAARQHGMVVLDGEVHVKLRVYRPRRAGDLDNTLKSALDSLKGIAWVDDSQIVRIEADRFEDKANPRIEIEVSQVEKPAIVLEGPEDCKGFYSRPECKHRQCPTAGECFQSDWCNEQRGAA